MLHHLTIIQAHEHLNATEKAMSSKKCRRREKRVIGAVQVVYDGEKVIAYNLSISGIAFNVNKNFNKKIGKSVPLTIVIPKSTKSAKKQKVTLEAEIKYSRFDITWNSHIIGLEYKKYSKGDKKRLKQLVHALDQMNLFFGERYFDHTQIENFNHS